MCATRMQNMPENQRQRRLRRRAACSKPTFLSNSLARAMFLLHFNFRTHDLSHMYGANEPNRICSVLGKAQQQRKIYLSFLAEWRISILNIYHRILLSQIVERGMFFGSFFFFAYNFAVVI